MSVIIRTATPLDAPRIQEIYAYYVKNTAVSYEYSPPTADEMASRIKHTLEKYPYLVVERDGRVMGYAYAGTLIARSAADWACEVTIYLDNSARGQGLGKMLYTALEEKLKAMGILNLYAAIAYPEAEDEYLTTASADFHSHLGFKQVARFTNCGYKFDRWFHLIWMEKIIGEHITPQPKVRPSFD